MAYKIKKIPWNTNKKTPWHAKKIEIPWNTKQKNTMDNGLQIKKNTMDYKSKNILN